MKKLGLNPTETEIQDLINQVEMNGYIYYPEFCQIMMRKFGEDDEENFHQVSIAITTEPRIDYFRLNTACAIN